MTRADLVWIRCSIPVTSIYCLISLLFGLFLRLVRTKTDNPRTFFGDFAKKFEISGQL